MLGRGVKNFKKSAVTGIIVALFAGLFLISLAAAFSGQGSMTSHKGEVLAINPEAKTITLRLFETDISSDIRTVGEVTFVVNDMTTVTMCDQVKAFNDIKVGDNVLITYDEAGAMPYANHIALAESPGMMPSEHC